MKLLMIYLGNGHATAGRQGGKRAFMAGGYAPADTCGQYTGSHRHIETSFVILHANTRSAPRSAVVHGNAISGGVQQLHSALRAPPGEAVMKRRSSWTCWM